MRRRRVRKNNDKGAPKWMVTYSDMVTLILVFFILLFSMSQIDSVKFQAVSESFRNRMIMDFMPSMVPADHPSESTNNLDSDKDIDEIDFSNNLPSKIDKDNEEDPLDSLVADVEKFLNENELNDVITATRTERGVVLVLQESILFESGEAEIIESGKPFLKRIGSLLSSIPNYVKVEGHTDSRPISNMIYPSNWELSGARSSSVIRYLIEENDYEESRFSAVGYGDTRSLVPNTSAENWSKNRRVEIVILEDWLEDDVS